MCFAANRSGVGLKPNMSNLCTSLPNWLVYLVINNVEFVFALRIFFLTKVKTSYFNGRRATDEDSEKIE